MLKMIYNAYITVAIAVMTAVYGVVVYLIGNDPAFEQVDMLPGLIILILVIGPVHYAAAAHAVHEIKKARKVRV